MSSYGKKKEAHEKKRKEISGKSQNLIELLPSAQPYSRNENFVSPSNNVLKNRNRFFLVVHCFTWKIEFVSNIWWMTVVSSQAEDRFIMGQEFLQHTFLFIPVVWISKRNKRPKKTAFFLKATRVQLFD